MRGSAFPQGRACAMHMTERQSSCGPSQTACLCQSGRARGGRTSGVHGFHVPLPLACSGRHCMAVPETATGHELLAGNGNCFGSFKCVNDPVSITSLSLPSSRLGPPQTGRPMHYRYRYVPGSHGGSCHLLGPSPPRPFNWHAGHCIPPVQPHAWAGRRPSMLSTWPAWGN